MNRSLSAFLTAIALLAATATAQLGDDPKRKKDEAVAIKKKRVRRLGQVLGDNLQSPDNMVDAIAWSPDGKQLIAGGADGTLQRFDTKSTKQLGTYPTQDAGCAGVHFNGTDKVWISGRKGPIRLYHLDGKPAQGELAFKKAAGIAYHFRPLDGGNRFITAHGNPEVCIWNTRTGEQLANIWIGKSPDPEKRSYIELLCVSPNGNRIAAGRTDGAVCVIDIESKSIVQRVKNDGEKGIDALAFVDDKRIALARNNEPELLILDVKSGKTKKAVDIGRWWILALARSPDGKQLAAATFEGLWLFDTKKLRLKLKTSCYSGTVRRMCWGPDSKRLATGMNDSSVLLFERSAFVKP